MESGHAELTAVQIQHINKAYNELHDGKNVQVMRTLRKYEIMVLVALTLEARGIEKVLVEQVNERADALCVSLNWEELREHEFHDILMRMKSFGLVNVLYENKLVNNIFVAANFYLDEMEHAFGGRTYYEKFKTLFPR